MIDLCSTTSDSSSGGEDEVLIISPVKPKMKCESPVQSSPEDIIKQEIPNVTDHEFHAEDIPILARPKQGLSVNQLFTLMIGAVPAERLCNKKPTSVTYSSVFVVNLLCVRNIDDLRADDNGAWIHGGKPRRCYRVDKDGSFISTTLYDGTPTPADDDVFTLVRAYHRHKATPQFQRRIAHVVDYRGQVVQYAVVQYLFDGGVEMPVTLPPHGNSKPSSTLSYRWVATIGELVYSYNMHAGVILCYTVKY